MVVEKDAGGSRGVKTVALVVIALCLILITGLYSYSYFADSPPNIKCTVTFADQSTESKGGLTGYMDAMAWMTVIEKQRGKTITAFECD